MDKVNSKNIGWILHLLIVTGMYIYYLYLWKDFIFYDGKAGWKGFGMFINTLYTAPFYLIFHLSTYFISRATASRKVMTVSLAGLAACIIHVCAVAVSL